MDGLIGGEGEGNGCMIRIRVWVLLCRLNFNITIVQYKSRFFLKHKSFIDKYLDPGPLSSFSSQKASIEDFPSHDKYLLAYFFYLFPLY